MLFFISVKNVRTALEHHLNTSHVILYPSEMSLHYYGLPYLNTSHVILYRAYQGCYGKDTKFKYISCYSLSLDIHVQFL